MKYLATFLICFCFLNPCYSLTLQAGVSVVDRIPQTFYGTWLVESTLIETNNENLFKEHPRDIWKFTRIGDSVILENPKSGATAEISVDEFEGDTASFSRLTNDDNQKEYEYPVISMKEKTFEGTDTYIIETYKNGKQISRDVVKYRIRGRKITQY